MQPIRRWLSSVIYCLLLNLKEKYRRLRAFVIDETTIELLAKFLCGDMSPHDGYGTDERKA